MLFDAVGNIISPSINIYIVGIASLQGINLYLGTGIDLLVVKDIFPCLLHDGILQKLKRAGIAPGTMKKYEIQLLNLNRVFWR